MKFKNIIIFMPRFLGDCINCTPAISLIKKHYPDSQVYLVLSEINAPIFRNDMSFKIIIDERKNNKIKGFLELVKKLRSVGDSAYVLMTNTFVDALVARLSKASAIVGYNKEARGFLLTLSLKFDRNRHYINRYAYLANALCDNKYQYLPELSLVFDKTKSSLHELSTFNIGLCILSAEKISRHYPVSSTVKLIQLIQESIHKDIGFFLIGSPAERETAENVVNQCQQKGLVNVQSLAGKTSITELVDDIASFDLLITVDSGPLHVAAATKTPTVALHSKGTSPFSLVCPKMPLLEVVNSRGSYIKDNDQVLDLMPEDIVNSVIKLMSKINTQ